MGLDVVERLIADSVVLQGRLARRVGSAGERAQATDLERVIGARRARLSRLMAERSALENTRQRSEEEQRAAEAGFARAGGRPWEERERRRQRLEELDSQSRDREAELCGLAAVDLPLAPVPDLLAAAERQDGRERHAAEAELIDRLLVERGGRLVALLRETKAAARVVDRVAPTYRPTGSPAGRRSRHPGGWS